MLYLLANNGLLSGRASGNVYQRNGRLRGFKVPALVQNGYTAAARTRFGQNSSDWNSLSDDERYTWNNMSGYSTTDRFGRTIPLVGKQLFVSLNNNLAAVGISTMSEAPMPALVDQILTLAVSDFDLSDTELALGFTPTPTAATVKHILFATAPQSAGTSKPNKSKYRQIAVIPGATATGVDYGAEYVSKFGYPPLGAKIFVKLIPIDTLTGNAGVPIFGSCGVVA
jgi:hypothetical protein